MNKIKKLCSLLIIISLMLLIIPSIALADQLYDKGRSYGTFLGGSNMSMEMNVVSASANCSVSGYLYGVERVSESELKTAKEFYNLAFINDHIFIILKKLKNFI